MITMRIRTKIVSRHAIKKTLSNVDSHASEIRDTSTLITGPVRRWTGKPTFKVYENTWHSQCYLFYFHEKCHKKKTMGKTTFQTSGLKDDHKTNEQTRNNETADGSTCSNNTLGHK